MNSKKIFLFFYLFLSLGFNSFSQGTWTQKPNVFSTPRAGAVGFSIGSKGYLGTGWDFSNFIYYNDFWEWNQATGAWTQKATFAGLARGDAAGFSIGSKGYIGSGKNGGFLSDFWEWDQAANTWSQKAMLSAARAFGAGFSIGLKGYLGFGITGVTSNDLWEYDQVTDTWTQMANIPIGRSTCVSFSINNIGYICTGAVTNGVYLDDLWAFDPALNSWIQKANFPGGLRGFAAGFSIGNKGYVGTGWDGTIAYADFWCYDPALDLWTQKTNYPHAVTDIDQGSFSVGCKGYFGTGANSPGSTIFYNDFWEYEPDTCNLESINDNANNHIAASINPNPFSEKLTIYTSSHQPAEIILYDNNAKEILRKKFVSSLTLNTKSFAKGIYFYEVRNKNGVIKKGKVMKE